MSLQVRISVLGDWLRYKVDKKEWIWPSLALTGYLWVASYI